MTDDEVRKYLIRVKRDDTFLRNLLASATTAEHVTPKLKGAKFAIGLLLWLDRCMLFRQAKNTKLMVVGIDYNHFPPFVDQGRDHCFLLDSYRTRTNVWGKSWRMFWSGLFGQYDDDAVNAFIGQHGVHFTNSMVCFGGCTDPNEHSREYVECCRPFIERQIDIAKPEVPGGVTTPAAKHGEYGEDGAGRDRCGDAGHRMKFWPMYQPARRHLHGYDGDYRVLRELLDVRPSG